MSKTSLNLDACNLTFHYFPDEHNYQILCGCFLNDGLHLNHWYEYLQPYLRQNDGYKMKYDLLLHVSNLKNDDLKMSHD